MAEIEKQYQCCNDYDTVRKLSDVEIGCYSRREFEKRYENGGYLLAGAIGGKEDAIGVLHHGEEEIAFHGCSYAKKRYEPSAYIRCEDDTYLVVLKDRVWKLLLWLLMVILLMGIVFLFLRPYLKQGPDLEPGTRDFKAGVNLPDDYGSTRTILPAFNPFYVVEGETQVKTVLWNPEKNQVYFQFQIVLDESGEVIYESRLVPPSQAIYELKLKRSFTRGAYPVTIRITTYDLKDYEQKLNGGEVQTKLNVVEEKAQ